MLQVYANDKEYNNKIIQRCFNNSDSPMTTEDFSADSMKQSTDLKQQQM